MKFDLVSEIIRNNRKRDIDIGEFDKVKASISDKSYLRFLEITNGGSIFKNAMNFYGVLSNELGLEIFFNNFLFKKYYGELIPNIFIFAEDVFGNQFGFMEGGVISFLNIETATIENTFKNFDQFVIEISNDTNYYTGYSIAEQWTAQNGTIDEYKRLCPIKPFVIGGTYSLDNFHLLNKNDLFDYNSFIAKQIKDLPDGTEIQLKVQ